MIMVRENEEKVMLSRCTKVVFQCNKVTKQIKEEVEEVDTSRKMTIEIER